MEELKDKPTVPDEKRLLGMLGLCRKSGKLIAGVPMICKYLSQTKKDAQDELTVIEAFDTSYNTHKRLCDRCEFYKVNRIKIFSDCITLGHAVGKGAVAAVAVVGKDMCRAISGIVSADTYSLYKSGKERS